MKPYEHRSVIGFTFIAGAFAIFATGNILTAMAGNFHDPGPPPGLMYHPVPPSCCGDSICSTDNHHD